MSGYELTIKVFIPADPRNPASMLRAAGIMDAWQSNTTITVGSPVTFSISEPRWIARRKIKTEPGHGSAARRETEPPDAPLKAVTGGAPTREECEGNQAGMPEIPAFLDRQINREGDR